MSYQPIIGTLGFVLSADKTQVLMVERTRDGDQHQGKFNGLGGKLEADEDIVTCLIRELQEEADITPTKLRLRGTISWPGFGKQGENWFGFIFIVDEYTGTPPDCNEDGPLSWVDVDKLADLPMWEGDRLFLPLVFEDGPQFHAVMPYYGGELGGWSYELLPGA